MNQYELFLPGEYFNDLLTELAEEMHILIDYERIESAANNDGEPGPHCVCTFKYKNAFILLDLQQDDWIHSVIVRCYNQDAERVKAIMLKHDRKARLDYQQELQNDLEDKLHGNSQLDEIVRKHGISI